MNKPIRIGGFVQHLSNLCYAIPSKIHQSQSETIPIWCRLRNLKMPLLRGRGIDTTVKGGGVALLLIDIQIALMALKSTHYGRA